MPTISDKAGLMPASPIRKLVPFAEAAVRAGKHVHYLNIGQPDIKTPEAVMERIRHIDRKVIEYSNSEGYASYRNGLAAYYGGVGIEIEPKEIQVTTGGSEALIFAFLACLNSGDEVIIPEPFYANYNSFTLMAGAKVVPVTSSIRDGFALPPIEDFEKKITSRTKAILICNPGNPTGYLYKREELEMLAALVKKHDLFLIADEVYREFCYDGAVPFSVMNLKGLEKNTVLIDSVSKRYSMCGVRIGALISRNEELMRAVLKFAQARLSPPTLGQIAAEAALETPQSYFDEVITEYVERRNILVEGLNAIPGVFCPKPAGAFYAMAELPIDDSDAFARWMLESFEFEGQTVMVAPATGFYSVPEKGLRQIRMAYVLKADSLRSAIKCIAMALQAYPGRMELPKEVVNVKSMSGV